ncbi:uncharacterized protein LOC130451639 isoform X3 [Diorhabda sublineata]|uniref:uncharacterized protein LOC130451639 isoform X3 n=1 Tax=Diorhabda sublineata TaxID=1163346 RepID=UPI0024E0946A|nr:uncharacterized protein LOC130451639 isoform X3 [Diorhabda sublineata]
MNFKRGNREEIILNLQKNYSKDFGKLSSLKWRIDISLSQRLNFCIQKDVIIKIHQWLGNESIRATDWRWHFDEGLLHPYT